MVILRFSLRHGDAEISALLETTVPPADITKVSIFAQPLSKYQKEASFNLLIANLLIAFAVPLRRHLSIPCVVHQATPHIFFHILSNA